MENGKLKMENDSEHNSQFSTPNSQLKKGYKQTEVGVIPVEWEVKPLSALATIATGNTPPTSDPSNYGDEFPFVGPMDMGNTKFISRTEKMLSGKGFAMSRRFPKGSILFVCIGSTIGKCGLAPVELTSNQQINAIFPSPTFSVDFLFYSVSAAAPRIKGQAGEQAVPIVNKTQFAGNIVALPPLAEQRAIAEALSDVDGLLGALDRLITKKRDLKQAAMQQLLTGQTRLPGFHGEWEVKRLGDLGKFKNGINKAKEDFGHGYPFANLMDVFGVAKVANSNSFGLVNSTPAERELYELRKGDVLFVRSSVKPAGVGLTSLIQNDLPNTVFSGFLLRFRDEEALTAEYKEHCFGERGFRERLIASSTVSANTNINQVSLRALTIKFPFDKAEQTAIAEVLSDMDAEIAALERRREKTRALKQGMMQELLTGRIRLVAPQEDCA
jgi:type I restriction enzyme S subunit